MKIIKLAVISVLVLALGAAAVLAFIVMNEVKDLNKTKAFLKETLSRELKVPVDFKDIHVDWTKLLRLQPACAIDGFTIGNPAGFRSPFFARADKISLELALGALIARQIDIKEISVIQPQINLEQNPSAKLNLDVWMQKLAASAPAAKKKTSKQAKPKNKAKKQKNKNSKAAFEFAISKVTLDKFLIEDGLVKLIDGTKQVAGLHEVDIKHVNIRANDFATDKASPITADFRLFKANEANLKYSGTIGPITESALPTNGNVDVGIFFLDIPAKLRKQYLGNLVLKPRKKDKLDIKTSINGDLLKYLSGNGEINLNRVRMGKSAERKIYVEGKLPFKFKVTNLLATTPDLDLNVSRSAIKIDDDGLLNANLNLGLTNGVISGNTSGSLKGLEINKHISAFSPNEDQIFGKFEIPKYEFRFRGKDADQIMNSLIGSGSITLTDGYLKMLSLIYKLHDVAGFVKQVSGQEAQQAAAAEETSSNKPKYSRFTEISTDFLVQNRRFNNSKIRSITPVGRINGRGYFDFDNNVSYNINVKSLNQKFPITIRGTMEKPKVSLDFDKFLQKQVDNKINNFVEKQLGQFAPKQGSQSPNQAGAGSTKEPRGNLFDSLIDTGLKELEKNLN